MTTLFSSNRRIAAATAFVAVFISVRYILDDPTRSVIPYIVVLLMVGLGVVAAYKREAKK